MRKVSLNYQVWFALLVISKPAITIFCICISYLLMVAKFYKVFKILRGNYVAYARKIRLALLRESSKADTFSLPLLSLTFQVMHLTISKSQTINFFSRSFLL